ncbi:MAG: FHA domain-containing protein [Galactobacter sp.]
MTEGQNQDPRSVERENAEATSVGLPRVTDEVIAEYQLSQEERAAVGALPVGSALLIAHAGGEPGARFLLDSDVTTVGRHPESDIFLDDVTVSRRHARFNRGDDGFRVVDTGSLNGTYVNGDRVDEAKLRTGAEVRIGKFVLTFYGRSQAQA